MEELTQVTTYQQYKQAMDTELKRTTEGFVRIGYLLKVARDTDILKESGYANVNEFAQAEYNIDKTQVSRFIHINDRFSEGGYSDRLLEQYQNFGHAKLTIMLQLPDELNEILTPDYTKAEIQALKEEVDEEKKITDLEVLMEGQDEAQAELDNNMAKALHQLFHENAELFLEVRRVHASMEEVAMALAPSGSVVYSLRLQGVGRMMLSVKDNEEVVNLVNVRTGEMESYKWSEMHRTICSMMNLMQTEKENWERIYGEPFPKEEEVAPVQPISEEKPAEKPAPRKESKVVKAKPAEKKPEPKPSTEEQLPGQMDITEYKEVLPEEVLQEMEVIPEEDIEVIEEPETSIPSLAESTSGEDKKKTIAGLKAGITSALHNIPRYMAAGNWAKVGEMLMDAKWRVDKIQELEGK